MPMILELKRDGDEIWARIPKGVLADQEVVTLWTATEKALALSEEREACIDAVRRLGEPDSVSSAYELDEDDG